MKKPIKFLNTVLILSLLIIISLYIFDVDYLLKAVRVIYLKGHNTAYLKDYKEFDTRIIEGSENFEWPKHKNYNKRQQTDNLKKFNTDYLTSAFIIIKNDSIWFEKYFGDYTKNSISNSFSVSKSMVTAMLGKAIMDGKIKSLNTKVSSILPNFNYEYAKDLTVGDLSSMASGSSWDEAYSSPFSITTRAYFHKEMKSVLEKIKIKEQPGQKFNYKSGDTQLLAAIITKVTGKTLSDYFSEKFWKPIGAKNALWQLDSKESGIEKAYCCVTSNARDFAKFGKLYKDYGKWNNEIILDSSFVEKCITPRFKESPQYGYGFWLLNNHKGKDYFIMRGHLGQYVIVNREDNTIIVRLGNKKGPKSNYYDFTIDIMQYIDEANTMLNAS